MAIWAGIKTAKMIMEDNQRLYQEKQPLHPNLKNQVTKILARSFRLTGNAVLNAITQQFSEMGINPGDFKATIDASRATRSLDEIQLLTIMHVTADSCKLMATVANEIEQGSIDEWTKKQSCNAPKWLHLDNFTLCEHDLPETENALKHVIFTTLHAIDESGLGGMPWRAISTDPCLRGMLGIEDPEETILTRFKMKKQSFSPEETMSFSLHQVLDTGNTSKEWWIFTSTA